MNRQRVRVKPNGRVTVHLNDRFFVKTMVRRMDVVNFFFFVAKIDVNRTSRLEPNGGWADITRAK